MSLSLLVLLSSCSTESDGPGAVDGEWMTVEEVVRDFVANPPEWTVVPHAEGREPTTGVICPALRHGLDGADRLSIVLPPPAEVRFRVGEFDEPRFLRLRAGVDISVVGQLGARHPTAIFGFEVQVDGVTVHSNEIEVSRTFDDPGTEWVDVGGPDGIPVSSGAEVALRTHVREPDGGEGIPPKAFRAGFGGVQLYRSREIPRTASSPEAPNLVLFVMDTLRRDRLSTYGYPRRTSPQLDAIAEDGVVFENAYSASSWTWPSTASMLTGLLPREHGVRDSSSCFLAYDLTTLAEVVQRAGITTAAWTGNPLISRSRGFDQGFESFEDDYADMRKAGRFMPRALEWIRAHAGTRFFLYLHLVETHRPLEPLTEGGRLFAPGLGEEESRELDRLANRLSSDPPRDQEGRTLLEQVVSSEARERASRLYDACVWSGDYWLGELVAVLDELGLRDETVLVFTADHGEEIFDRSRYGHGQQLYEELVHVPLVIAGPHVPRGRRVESVLPNRWVGPFLASVAGLRLEDDLDGSRFFATGQSDRVVLFSTEHGNWKGFRRTPLLGMRSGRYVLQVAPEAGPWGSLASPPPQGDMALFDVVEDPGQKRDLSAERADVAARLRRELERRFDALEPRSAARTRAGGAGTAELLERLGYTGQ